MKKIITDETCPKCKSESLYIEKSNFHHIEKCSNDNCDYSYEEYLNGYEDFLYKEF